MKKAEHPTWISIKLESVTKTSFPNPALDKSFRYINCYSLNSPITSKSLVNSIRSTCLKIWSSYKDYSSQLSFIRCTRQHLRPSKQTIYCRFTFAKNISSSTNVARAKFYVVIDSFVFLASSAYFQRLLAYLNLDIRFILSLQTKELIPIRYGSITNSWKPSVWMRFDPVFRWRIYTSIPTRTHTQNSKVAVKVPSSIGNWNNMVKISQWSENHCRTNNRVGR